jgi:PAS domain S-box-containing protein
VVDKDSGGGDSGASPRTPKPLLRARRRADKRLRETEERYRALVEAAAQIVWTTPADGVVEDMPLWRAYTGQTVAQVKGWGWLDALHPDDRARTAHLWSEAVAAKRVCDVEYRVRRDDGVYHDFLTRAVPVCNDDGGIREWVGICTDITARKRADEQRALALAREQAARAEAERARAGAVAQAAERDAMFEAMADGIFTCDREGKVVRMNAAYRAIMAFDGVRESSYPSYSLRERMLRIDMRDEQGRSLPGEQWPVARILRGEVLSGAQPDVMVRTADGRDVLLNVSGAPMYDGEGSLIGGVCVCRDVTERRQLEQRTYRALDALLDMAEALVQGRDEGAEQETEVVARRLAALACSVLDCRRVSITAYDTATGASRPLAVVGVTPAEERAWREGQPGSTLREYLDAAHVERLLGEDVLVLDAAALPDRALPYDVRTLLLALLRVGSRVVGVLALDHGGVAHSYTPDEVALARTVAKLSALVIERERLWREREEARANEAALREANRRMDEFLGIAGHEMRTPLTTIKGNIQVARRRLERLAARDDNGGADLADDLRGIGALLGRGDGQIARLNRLVDDLLDVSRIRAGYLEVRPEPSDLAALVREVVAEQREIAAPRAIQLEGDGRADVPVVVDHDRIAQVLTNYISNALRYSPPERPIVVGLHMDEAEARVWVRDEGPGLSPGEQARVWDRFYRVAGVEHRYGSSVGLGLGLHISRTIIAQHGGQVGVESVAGAGATFWFSLPLVREPRQSV